MHPNMHERKREAYIQAYIIVGRQIYIHPNIHKVTFYAAGAVSFFSPGSFKARPPLERERERERERRKHTHTHIHTSKHT